MVVVDQVSSIHHIKMINFNCTGFVLFSLLRNRLFLSLSLWMTISPNLFRSVWLYDVFCLKLVVVLFSVCLFDSHYCGQETCCIRKKNEKATVETNQFFFFLKKAKSYVGYVLIGESKKKQEIKIKKKEDDFQRRCCFCTCDFFLLNVFFYYH